VKRSFLLPRPLLLGICGAALALVCGCASDSVPYRPPYRHDISGRVQLRAVQRAADGTDQGRRMVMDADGVPVDVRGGGSTLATMHTVDGGFSITIDIFPSPFEEDLRTKVGQALADSVGFSNGASADDTLDLFSDEAVQLRPNPFDAVVEIRLDVPADGRVVVEVRSLSGAVIRVLADVVLPAGVHAVAWDGTNAANVQVPRGSYYWILTTIGGVQHAELAIRAP
jgi:hypothetical protein